MEKVFRQIKILSIGKMICSIGISLLLLGVINTTFISFSTHDLSFFIYPLSWAILCLTVVLSFLKFFIRRKKCFQFVVADLLVIILLGYWFLRYDFDLQLANWKLFLFGELCILWFSIRMLLECNLISVEKISWVLLSTGIIQSVWGILQLYGFCESNHSKFDITGSFFNPGPYSGYIAIMVPVSLYLFLSTKCMKRYVALFFLAVLLCILPAGMSRSAWIGAIVSSVIVLFWQNNWIKYWYLKRKLSVLCLVVGVVGIAVGSYLMFNLKKDSAYGRLFIWKNTVCAIWKKPVFGYRSCMFPVAYAQEQTDRFRSGKYTATEERVAGNPEYAFNEYLQILVEGGCLLLFGVVVIVAYALSGGIKRRDYGLCGGLISLLIFAFSSYPFQYPAFCVVAVIIVASLSTKRTIGVGNNVYGHCVLVFLVAASIFLLFLQDAPKGVIEKLDKCRYLRSTDALEVAEKGYAMLYPDLKHNADFVYEYGLCLSQQKKYLESNELLRRSMLLRCNYQCYNALGGNSQQQQNYEQAEKYYYDAIYLLPNRIYSYYRLFLLYAQPEFYQPDKLKQMAKIVLTKRPKVYSKAIEEMRGEVKVILKEHGLNLSN